MLLAAFSPFALLRLIPMVEGAAHASRPLGRGVADARAGRGSGGGDATRDGRQLGAVAAACAPHLRGRRRARGLGHGRRRRRDDRRRARRGAAWRRDRRRRRPGQTAAGGSRGGSAAAAATARRPDAAATRRSAAAARRRDRLPGARRGPSGLPTSGAPGAGAGAGWSAASHPRRRSARGRPHRRARAPVEPPRDPAARTAPQRGNGPGGERRGR